MNKWFKNLILITISSEFESKSKAEKSCIKTTVGLRFDSKLESIS